jgi:hypothetical protein
MTFRPSGPTLAELREGRAEFPHASGYIGTRRSSDPTDPPGYWFTDPPEAFMPEEQCLGCGAGEHEQLRVRDGGMSVPKDIVRRGQVVKLYDGDYTERAWVACTMSAGTYDVIGEEDWQAWKQEALGLASKRQDHVRRVARRPRRPDPYELDFRARVLARPRLTSRSVAA